MAREQRDSDRSSAAKRRRAVRARDRLVLIGVLAAVALLARGPRLSEGLWYDELAAWTDYASKGPLHVLTTYHDPANHVLQSLLTWVSFVALAPALGAELAMRLPSLLASLVAIPLIAGVARAAGLGRRGAVVAAGFAAACPLLALAGTEARGYAFMIAGAAGATWIWLRLMDGPGRDGEDDDGTVLGPDARRHVALRPSLVLAYAGCMLVGTWAHPVTAVVAAGHAAVAVAEVLRTRQPAGLRRLIPVAAAGLLTAAAWSPLLPSMLDVRGSFVRTGGDQPGLLGAEGRALGLAFGGAWSLWALPGLVAMAAGVAALARHHTGRRLLAAWLAGAGVLVAVATVGGTWIYARFGLFLVPGTVVAIAAGVMACARRAGVVPGALLALAVLGGWAIDLADRPPRQPIREAAAWIEARRGPGEPVLEIGLRQTVGLAYLRPEGYALAPDLGADLAVTFPAPAPRYLMVLYPDKVAPATRRTLTERGYRRAVRFDGWIDWTHGDVEVWERGGSGPTG